MIHPKLESAKKFFKKCEIEIPQSSIEALDEYKSASQDENELYFLKRIEQTYDEKDRIQSSELFADYREWCRENNVKKMLSQTAFSETMVRKGYKKRKNNCYYFLNVKYKENVAEFMNSLETMNNFL